MYYSRDELIDLIISNNMIDKFIEWLQKQGFDTSEPISIKDIDYELLYRFAKENNLLDTEEQNTLKIDDITSIPEPEELKMYRRPTKPKKIRSKR